MDSLPQLGRDLLQGVDLVAVLVNLGLALLLGSLLGWHYVRFAHVLSNKRKLARIFVLIAATTLLIITVVKSSLALSLGLIGALSIIRFRTPIKEPEELAYLFLAIAVGVGLGADQRAPTVVVFAVILLFSAWFRRPQHRVAQRTIVEVSAAPGAPASAELLPRLLAAVQDVCAMVDLRRVDSHAGRTEVYLTVDLPSAGAAAELLRSIDAALPGAVVSIIDRESQE